MDSDGSSVLVGGMGFRQMSVGPRFPLFVLERKVDRRTDNHHKKNHKMSGRAADSIEPPGALNKHFYVGVPVLGLRAEMERNVRARLLLVKRRERYRVIYRNKYETAESLATRYVDSKTRNGQWEGGRTGSDE
jgi:hypothetical protein